MTVLYYSPENKVNIHQSILTKINEWLSNDKETFYGDKNLLFLALEHFVQMKDYTK